MNKHPWCTSEQFPLDADHLKRWPDEQWITFGSCYVHLYTVKTLALLAKRPGSITHLSTPEDHFSYNAKCRQSTRHCSRTVGYVTDLWIWNCDGTSERNRGSKRSNPSCNGGNWEKVAPTITAWESMSNGMWMLHTSWYSDTIARDIQASSNRRGIWREVWTERDIMKPDHLLCYITFKLSSNSKSIHRSVYAQDYDSSARGFNLFN